VERLQLRRLDLLSEASSRRCLLSIHIEEFEVMGAQPSSPEEITRDIPTFRRSAEKLDEAGIVYIGAEVRAGDILCGKITPKGESR